MIKNKRILRSLLNGAKKLTPSYDQNYSRIISNRKDGLMFEFEREDVLPFSLFIDDFTLSFAKNRKTSLKLTAITMRMETLSYEIAKSEYEMDIVILTKASELMKENALKMVIRAIVEDLNSVAENGIEYSIDGKTGKLYPKLTSICGDNLAKPMLAQYSKVSTINKLMISD